MKNILDNTEFQKILKPFLSDKKIVFFQISIEKNRQNYI